MPYEWSTTENAAGPARRLRLWPHRSLPRKGFAAFVLVTFSLITLPLYPLLGTVLLWGLLPFLLLAVAGVWWGLERSYRDARLSEELTIDRDEAQLVRVEANGQRREWSCESYWARVQLHQTGGPVPDYVTLSGKGREVEIGAFLSQDERRALYGELAIALRQVAAR
ncbi:DUF2244 domain-containing protein [Roseovarius amoyensis]|uniref:DUF2244 domain-containing protein n=1 Tax=Roseovarius amoyensis TaxID=2211448 RepID=UPI000DBE79EA|nr:DUF2244 domain-containing protein [Roseovarius amoyensis]